MTDLTGKVAVVVGCSAERGTGWAVAKTLAKAGAKVVVASRTLHKLKVLAEEIGGVAVACDIGNEAQVAEVAKTAVDTYGGLDIAVNCSMLGVRGMIEDIDIEALQSSIHVNLYGNVYFVQHMAKAIGEDGSIVIFSSMSTTHPNPPFFPYSAGKAAADCLVRYAAIEYGRRNIRVNSILAGPIISEASHNFLTNPVYADVFKQHIPLKRIGLPDDFADAVLWLAGSAFVTGLNLHISGGMQLARLPYEEEVPNGAALVVSH